MVERNNDTRELLEQSARIIAAYVSNNAISARELPDLIGSVHDQMKNLSVDTSATEALVPAVPVGQSVTYYHIVCLEDGKKFKMLKRYLGTRYGMSPDEYRERWNLPSDYPMVAPEYAERRSKFAKEAGLGKKRG